MIKELTGVVQQWCDDHRDCAGCPFIDEVCGEDFERIEQLIELEIAG